MAVTYNDYLCTLTMNNEDGLPCGNPSGIFSNTNIASRVRYLCLKDIVNFFPILVHNWEIQVVAVDDITYEWCYMKAMVKGLKIHENTFRYITKKLCIV